MKDYEVSITTEITLTRIIPAESEEEALEIAYDTPVGHCIVSIDDANEECEGYIHEIYDEEEDIVIENPDDEDEE